MKKFIIEECLDGNVWDCYTGEMIEAETLDDAIDIYKGQLLESGEFTADEVDTMEYRAYAQTQYILRRDDADKTYIRQSTDEEKIFKDLEILGGEYCVEKVVLDIGGEPLTDSEWFFNDERLPGDDDYLRHEIKDKQEIYEEYNHCGKNYALAPAICDGVEGIYVHCITDGGDYFVSGIHSLPKNERSAAFLVDHLDRMSDATSMDNVILASSGEKPSLLKDKEI